MKIINAEFSGSIIQFQSDGWFNATVAANKFNKRPTDWLRLKETQSYLEALAEELRSDSGSLYKSKKGKGIAGTWMHPKLAVAFARWLDVRFAVWCDVQIDRLINVETDWRKQRHIAASSYKLMSEMLKESRQESGKETKAYHYSNEAKMVNWALTGEFCSLERDQLSAHQLDVLAALESRNALLIGRGVEYAKRKIILEQLAIDMRKPELKLVGGGL